LKARPIPPESGDLPRRCTSGLDSRGLVGSDGAARVTKEYPGCTSSIFLRIPACAHYYIQIHIKFIMCEQSKALQYKCPLWLRQHWMDDHLICEKRKVMFCATSGGFEQSSIIETMCSVYNTRLHQNQIIETVYGHTIAVIQKDE